VLPVGGELLYGLGGCLEKGRIGRPLVASDEAAQTLGNGEREHEMVAGQLPAHLGFKPLPGLVMLAGGTMAIPARAVNNMSPSTLLTLVISLARLDSAALHYGIDGLFMLLWHVVAKAVYVVGTKGAEDLTYRCHS
jgi:hypothetical protein